MLALFGECVPSLEFAGPTCEDVLEPAERAAPFDRDGQAVGVARVVHGGDEQFHIPVGIPRPLAVHPQPPLGVICGVLVFLYGFAGVFDRCLGPDFTRLEVEAAAPVERVAFEDAGQLVKVDR
jgi:hypothetical protein